jgi:hypothetical protein
VSIALPDLALPTIAGGPVRLSELLSEGPTVLLFVHADCPTARLTLQRLAPATGLPLTVVAQETPDGAARLARRAHLDCRVLVEGPPYALATAYDVTAVPTAVVLEADGTVAEQIVGWDRDGLARVLGADLGEEEPLRKPGCQARNTYDPELPATAGLDELDDMFERGWTDGLPVVPPTPERVEAMLGGADPTRSLGAVPPGLGEATLERVAACAVLAGCRPDYFPVVVAAVEAALDPAFNLNGQAVTTSPPGQIVLVNGPVREAIGLNSGMGALGPGWRANMTIGRAVRLVVALTGEGMPGRLDRATLGHQGKLSFCLAENEEASPWEPFHAERGLSPETSAVTLLAGDAPLSISDHRSRTPAQLAATLAWAGAATWSPNWWPVGARSLFVLCPEHVALFAASGWTKNDVREAVWEAARRPAGELTGFGETSVAVAESPPDAEVRKWESPDEILLVVAGGDAGRFSAVIGPCVGMGWEPITREVAWST